MKGYVCRSKNSDSVMISEGSKPPKKKGSNRYWYIPGWFVTFPIQAFKKNFGFSVEPGTHKRVNISIAD